MSKKPGIGATWYAKYGAQVAKHDSVIVGGKEVRPPRYYDEQLDQAKLEEVKKKRRAQARKGEFTYDRLRAKEKVKEAQMRFVKRNKQ